MKAVEGLTECQINLRPNKMRFAVWDTPEELQFNTQRELMKKLAILALLAVSVSAFGAFHFKVGPIKVSSKTLGQIKEELEKPGDKVKSIAKGVGKWADTELITTVKGERALRIKPYIALTHKGEGVKVGPDEAFIKVAGLSLKTSQFNNRLAQIGCVMASEGSAAAICSTLAAKQLFEKEAGAPGIPAGAVGGAIPEPEVTENPTSNYCKAEPEYSSCFVPEKRPVGSMCACFNEKGDLLAAFIEPGTRKVGNMTEVMIPPPKPGASGFNF